MTLTTFYGNIAKAQGDVVMDMMNKYHEDTDPRKIDLSVGVYKPENGDIKYVFPSVKKAKKEIYDDDQGHPYHQMSGFPRFIEGAKKTVFGEAAAGSDRISSIQTISGTGAVHIGIEFLKNLGFSDFYVGTPAWGNYQPMIENNGCKFIGFNHYDTKSGGVDMESVLNTIDTMPDNSVILLQACCHNPTGADYTHEQWVQICNKIKTRKVFTLFDTAYQGFASGDKDEDAWGIRHFFDQHVEFAVCESFSKNMGLYGERVGCLHIVCNDSDHSENISGLLVSVFRAQCSFGPLFGARIASYLFNEFKQEWDQDVKQVADRIANVRASILAKFNKLQTPGDWTRVVEQNGLFWFSGLTTAQTEKLINEHHIFLLPNGRFNVAGFNDENIDYIVECIDQVVRGSD